MANVKVSELPAASAASTSQEFEVNDSGTSKKVTGSQIKSFVKDGLVLTDITDVTASITELNYVDGVTSAIQTQLNDKFKQRTITGTTDQITVTNGDGVAGNPTLALAFQPVQQGGGTGQLTNKVYIGWSGSQLKATVDSTDLGAFQFGGPTTAQVLSAMAGASADSVGSYSFLRKVNTAVAGTDYAGSSLLYGGLRITDGSTTVGYNTTAGARSGTWRCMAGASVNAGGTTYTLYLRIA